MAAEGILNSTRLNGLAWLEHGFGTREAAIAPDAMASLRQIHSAIPVAVSEIGNAGEGDALVTATSKIAVSVRTADCYPILLADTRRRAVAAIHAGWRGTAGKIVTEALTKMTDLYGTCPSDVVAAIGPGIGVCCYQVGQEVARRFGQESAGHIDLGSINRGLLIEAGVPDSQIEVLGLCTVCDPRFYSYRREKDNAGRMISFIRIL